MRRYRKTEGFNLAFLDVMSCGLGAAVLIFLITKHNVDKGLVEAEILLNELETMEQQEQQLREEIRGIRQHASGEQKLGAELKDRLQALQDAIVAVSERLSAQKKKNKTLRSSMEKAEPERAADVVPDEVIGEEEYLIGMKVEGARVAILVDHSASMTDEKLVDIVIRKIRSDAHRKKGPKWERTKKAVRWLLNNLPAESKVSVVAFSDRASTLGANPWSDSKDPAAIGSLFQEMENLVPAGATNLQAGLNELRRLDPRATSIYLITDGLPTQGVSRAVRLGKCGSLFGKSNNITGECREKLFWQTLRESAPAKGKKVNVLLFPLEGDPEASRNFWRWTASTGGVMMTPVEGWP